MNEAVLWGFQRPNSVMKTKDYNRLIKRNVVERFNHSWVLKNVPDYEHHLKMERVRWSTKTDKRDNQSINQRIRLQAPGCSAGAAGDRICWQDNSTKITFTEWQEESHCWLWQILFVKEGGLAWRRAGMQSLTNKLVSADLM